MRKLKLQIQMSIDGYVSGPAGELDWIMGNWDAELKKYVYNMTWPVDCIVLGRNTAPVIIEHWQNRMNDPKAADSFARKMVDTPKIVFSKTLESINGKNTSLAKGDLIDEIDRLKKLKGRDIIAYGGVSFVSSLIKADLIDEYNLFINPVVIGQGKTIFKDMENHLNMELVYSTYFDCGMTVLCYVPKRKKQNSANPVNWSTGSIAR